MAGLGQCRGRAGKDSSRQGQSIAGALGRDNSGEGAGSRQGQGQEHGSGRAGEGQGMAWQGRTGRGRAVVGRGREGQRPGRALSLPCERAPLALTKTVGHYLLTYMVVTPLGMKPVSPR